MNSQTDGPDHEDPDEDFETFIANRRRQRDTQDLGIEARVAGRISDPCTMRVLARPDSPIVCPEAATSWRRPRAVRVPMTLTSDEATTAKLLSSTTRSAPDRSGATAEALRSIEDEYGFLDFNDLDAPLECEWYMPSPTHQPSNHSESPLFLPQQRQTSAPVAWRQPKVAVSQLLPPDYDSDSRSVTADAAATLYNTTRSSQTPTGTSGSTLAATMHDAFAQSSYVNAMRQNPYTSGIFEYQGASRVEATTNRRTAARPKQCTNSVRNAEQRGIKMVTHTHKRYRPHEIQHVETPRGDNKANSNTIRLLTRPSLSPVKMGSSQATQLTHEGAQKDCLKPQPRDSAGTNALSSLFQDNVQTYQEGLRLLGCDVKEGSLQWCTLKSQISHSIDSFTKSLQKDKYVDREEFKIALEAWEMEIATQIVMKKYIMYSSLLKATCG